MKKTTLEDLGVKRGDVIKMQLKEIGYKSVVWINLTQQGPVAHFWKYGNES